MIGYDWYDIWDSLLTSDGSTVVSELALMGWGGEQWG